MKFLRFLAPALLFASSAIAQGDLAALLESDPELSTLLTAIGLVEGLNDTLSTATNITIFAPTNEAFTSLPDDSPEGEAVAAEDAEAIAALLSLHVVQGMYDAASIPDSTPAYLPTLLNSTSQPYTNYTEGQNIGVVLNGETAQVISGGYTISSVTEADLMLGEIVIHKIDNVLRFAPTVAQLTSRSNNLRAVNAAVQEAGLDAATLDGPDLTFFLPVNSAFENIGSILANATPETLADVLSYHVVPDIVFASDLGNFSTASLGGPELNFTVFPDGTAYVNEAQIIFPNVLLFNGVAHIIDTVLNPENITAAEDSESEAEDRVQFEGATATESLAFTTYSADTTTYSTPTLLSTLVAIADPTTVPTEAPAGADDEETAAADSASQLALGVASLTFVAAMVAAVIVL